MCDCHHVVITCKRTMYERILNLPIPSYFVILAMQLEWDRSQHQLFHSDCICDGQTRKQDCVWLCQYKNYCSTRGHRPILAVTGNFFQMVAIQSSTSIWSTSEFTLYLKSCVSIFAYILLCLELMKYIGEITSLRRQKEENKHEKWHISLHVEWQNVTLACVLLSRNRAIRFIALNSGHSYTLGRYCQLIE